jgi:hypothetical protein
VGLTLLSQNVLADSIAALGLMIAFYYGLVGYACPIFFRRELSKSPRNALLLGVAPTLGALMLTAIFVKSGIDLAKPELSGSGTSWFGVGPPVVIAVACLVIGLVLMALQWRREPDFFRQPRDVAAQSPVAVSAGAPAPLDIRQRNALHRAEADTHRQPSGDRE